MIFLRRAIIVLSVVTVFISLALVGKYIVRSFVVHDVVVTGNHHLESDKIVKTLHMGEETSLLSLRFTDIEEPLRSIPWIRQIAMRRQLPDTLMIRIEEAVPKALLSRKGHTYLLEEGGSILEEMSRKGIQFLPVISDIDPEREKKELREALSLVDALTARDIISETQSVEIGLKPFGLEMRVDGELVKIGFGRYREKLDRWKDLESTMNEIGAASYVDLRFPDRVIVKPLRMVKKKVHVQ